jgi:hypothetical protein
MVGQAGNVTLDREGNLLFLHSDGGTSAILENRDRLGQPRWTTRFDGWPGGLTTTLNGDVLAAASIQGTMPTDPTVRMGGTPRHLSSVTRADQMGKVIWSSSVGDDTGDLGNNFVAEAPNGDILLAGQIAYDVPPQSLGPRSTPAGFFTARFTSSGQLLWEHNWDRDETNLARGYVVDASGRLGVLVWVQSPVTIDGVTFTAADYYKGYVVWFESDGHAKTAVDVTEDSQERFDGVITDETGGLYVFGWIPGPNPGVFTSELVVAALSPAGEHLWAQRFSVTDQSDDGVGLLEPCGDILFAGNGEGPNRGFLAVRLGRDGTVRSQINPFVAVGGWVGSVAPAPGGLFASGTTGPNLQRPFVARLSF